MTIHSRRRGHASRRSKCTCLVKQKTVLPRATGIFFQRLFYNKVRGLDVAHWLVGGAAEGDSGYFEGEGAVGF